MKTAVGIALVIMLLALAYYFGIALPEQNRAKLQFERDKFEQERKEKQNQQRAKELEAMQKHAQRGIEKKNAEDVYHACRVAAENDFNKGLELNGTPIPGEKGSYNLPSETSKVLHKQQNDEKEACRKVYEVTLKDIDAE